MKLSVTQNSIGKYNILSNDSNFSFYMVIKDDDGNTITDEHGNKAMLHYYGDPDMAVEFEDAIEFVDHILPFCWKYANGICSSTDYVTSFILFCQLYMENFEELNNDIKESKQKSIQASIDRLQSELDKRWYLEEIDYKLVKILNDKISTYTLWINQNQTKQLDMKKDSPSYNDLQDNINKYKGKIDQLKKLLAIETVYKDED